MRPTTILTKRDAHKKRLGTAKIPLEYEPESPCTVPHCGLQGPPALRHHGFRRGGRVVDRAALEMRSTRKGTGGSNPSLSANVSTQHSAATGEIFYTLKEAQIIIENWRQHHNYHRPHIARLPVSGHRGRRPIVRRGNNVLTSKLDKSKGAGQCRRPQSQSKDKRISHRNSPMQADRIAPEQ